jgi:hypothetical protein
MFARISLIKERPLAGYRDSEDALSHVLATNLAYSQVDWKEHKFLPIFTLGAERNKYINDLPTSAAFDDKGNAYYTSFPPLGFVAPYLLGSALGIDPSIVWIRTFNMFLHLLSAGLLGVLTYTALANVDSSRGSRLVAAFIATSIYIAAPEPLKSHSIAYWPQQLYQPIFLAQVILFIQKRCLSLFLLLSLVAIFVEWTAYIANLGFVCASLLSARYGRDSRVNWRIASQVSLVTLLGFTLTVLWFALNIGVHEFFSNLAGRAGTRSGNIWSFLALPLLYIQSVGVFIFVFCALAGAAAIRSWRSRGSRKISNSIAIQQFVCDRRAQAVMVTTFVLLENVLLSQHSIAYTYDRLKAVVLIALLTALLAHGFRRRLLQIYATVFVSGCLSIAIFWSLFVHRQNYQALEYSFYRVLGEVIYEFTPHNAIAFLNSSVRGHHLVYARRNIYEKVDKAAASQRIDEVTLIRNYLKTRSEENGVLFELNDEIKGRTLIEFSRFNYERLVGREFAWLALLMAGGSDAEHALDSASVTITYVNQNDPNVTSKVVSLNSVSSSAGHSGAGSALTTQ